MLTPKICFFVIMLIPYLIIFFIFLFPAYLNYLPESMLNQHQFLSTNSI